MPQNFYLTTTLPYVNADPHIGFAMEIVCADAIVRAKKQQGFEVRFNTGTDEHGQKIYQNAIDAGQDPQEYVDHYAAEFGKLKELLDLSYTDFIRTTDPHHKSAAQEFWRRCKANGYIYKAQYQSKYCVGCELEKQDSELVEGKCPLHPTKEIELRDEENYFFKFSAFQDALLQHYQANPEFVQPAGKMSEIVSFVQQGLKDFSISRLKSKMSWGVPVPDDDEHVMYVWFDALVNYISVLGWPEDSVSFEKWWPGTQIAGKDNLRQQAAMWQAMLHAAGLPFSRQILINGFISVNGEKMSKSLGNVISPAEMVSRYGTQGTRYLLLKLGPVGGDMDVSWEKFDQTYLTDLSNGLGNLCSRVAKLMEKNSIKNTVKKSGTDIPKDVGESLENHQVAHALSLIWDRVTSEDKYLATHTPWTKSGDEQAQILLHAVETIQLVALSLEPFMPQTAQTIYTHFTQETIHALSPLFPRI